MSVEKVNLGAAGELAIRSLIERAPLASSLAEAFKKEGFRLALVGGPVRDAILGRLGNDLDFTTDAHPHQTKKILKSWADNVWDTGILFGTVAGKRGDTTVEVTTYRTEKYEENSRNPDVEFGDTIEGDLSRRDFTVNSMALELTGVKPEFIDPFDGLGDLAKRVLRTPSSATQSFSDDPLRMMRAARFASQLGFDIDSEVTEAMTSMASRISIISAERVRDEFVKLLMSDRPRIGITILVDTGLADLVVPEIPKLRLEIDEHHHHKDVYEHSITVLEQAISQEERLGGPNLVIRLAALLHDIGKPKTRNLLEGGGVSFHHHEVVGSRLSKNRMKALRFDNDTIEAVETLVALHLRFHGYGDGEWTDSAVRRYVRDAGDLLVHLHVLTRADCTTRNAKKADRLARTYDGLEARIAKLSEEEELSKIRPDLDGAQVMSLLGIKPSADVGKALDFLMELRMEHGPLGEERATEELIQWWKARRHP
ncbi:poly(A) polymerase [Candidatus Planktophila sulfonica]|uniref:Poly(A) polymerase n=1 Tax=Candidatus Planktophila sulfonica TaxID=1884904 RepID=A0A249KIK8_9ACTN|nr:CCA tRNA nucleotidyltransferase [Candidatus Planktophila sulfonica]ASY16576.1 poly(A) polymerase [Candidatus Planktophila sulfonica]